MYPPPLYLTSPSTPSTLSCYLTSPSTLPCYLTSTPSILPCYLTSPSTPSTLPCYHTSPSPYLPLTPAAEPLGGAVVWGPVWGPPRPPRQQQSRVRAEREGQSTHL